jgi:TetR/AcrR family transcriptional regulator, transcriptional repressor for nem operon
LARSKEFDVDKALWAAVKVFWQRGYAGASVQNLVEAMGIERGSLYATYGDKEQLFLQALERYARSQLERLPRHGGPAAALRAWFCHALDDAASGRLPGGCLVVNAAVESPSLSPAVRALVQRHLADLRGFCRACVAGCVREGLAPCGLDPDQTAHALLAAFVGLQVAARAGAPRAQLDPIADSALAFLRSEAG